MASFSADLAFRGLIHQVSDDSLLARLDAGGLTGYTGFDPTGDSLHVGHLLPLLNLRRLQRAGHRPIALAGGGTGLIGDPGGKTEERPLLSQEALEANLAGIKAQLEGLLDFAPSAGDSRALLLNNADWLCDYQLVDFLRDVGKHFTVNQMVAKESVKTRLARPDQGISFTEFSYMLLQACDFLHLFDHFDCKLQMGGSDQWGNITMGTELIRKERRATAWALTSPLIVKPDGTKFGKTESGAIFLDRKKTSPFAFYQYFWRSDDALTPMYLRFFTFLDQDTILSLDNELQERPADRAAQRALAHAVCALVHGEDETRRVEQASEALYSEDIAGLDEETLLMVFDDAPTTTLSRSAFDGAGVDLVEILVQTGLSKSKTQARDAIRQGGVYVNNRRVDADSPTIEQSALIADRYVVLRRGRQDVHLLCFS